METINLSIDTNYNPNDDPMQIYSAAWYAKHGVKVLRHDRKRTQHEHNTHNRSLDHVGQKQSIRDGVSDTSRERCR